MAHFAPALDFVLAHEGGFVDDPVDPGGATNWGISLAFLNRLEGAERAEWDLDLDGDIDPEDIRLLDRDDAARIYQRYWWDRYEYGAIGPQMIAAKLFDLAVNMGATQAGRIVQRACCALGESLSIDGAVGPETRAAILELWPSSRPWGYRPQHPSNLPAIIAAIRAEAGAFYRLLISQKPERRKYETGWLRRAYD